MMKPSEAAWREAWIGSPHSGLVDIAVDSTTGEEQLVIKCREVLTKYGVDACIIDDGRTVGAVMGDLVGFGVVPRPGKSPMAVNVWRQPRNKNKLNGQAMAKDSTKLPDSLSGDLTGIVRYQSPWGHYFVNCPEVWQVYQKDPKITVEEMPVGVGIGDAIVFSLDAPPQAGGNPLAKTVARATGAASEAIVAKLSGRGAKGKGHKGKGKGKGGEGGGGKGFGGKSHGGGTRRPSGEAVMRMVGMVKNRSPATGRHFVLCQDISDVYGRDAQIPVEEEPEGGLRVGDRIAFDVEDPYEGYRGCPLARHVRIVKTAAVKQKSAAVGDDGEDETAAPDEDEEDDLEGAGVEEPLLDDGEFAEIEAQDRMEIGAAADHEESDDKTKVISKPKLKASSKAAAGPKKASPAPVGGLSEPDTPEGWLAVQHKFFPGMPALQKGWIRIRSKSKGLVYYYNIDSGESSAVEPRLR